MAPGNCKDPSGIATNSLGDIFIADAGSAFITKFAAGGKPLLSFQEDGLNHPQSVAVDRGGALYVTDPVRNSVFIFLPNGDRYRELRLRTRPVAGNALSVAVGDDGLIHVLDSHAGKVFSYTSRLRLVQTWQPRETFPGSKRFGPLVKGPDDYLYLGDALGRHHEAHARRPPDYGNHPKHEGCHLESQRGLRGLEQLRIRDGFQRPHAAHRRHTDGVHKLDMDLAPELGQACPQSSRSGRESSRRITGARRAGIARPALSHQLLISPYPALSLRVLVNRRCVPWPYCFPKQT